MSIKKIALLPLIACFCVHVVVAQSVSYSTLFDNTSFSRSIDLSRPVGAIEGAAGTSPSGAATYTIPIKTPPGTNGMAPQLSIVYNSQGGNGILGQGWSLSGLSVITKVGNDFYHDGNVSQTKYYDNENPYVLDGMRMAVKSGVNGGDGATYRIEAESYATISSHEMIGTAPKYFKVVSKDGTIWEYGNSDNARFLSDDGSKVMMWRLNKIQDVNGNYISFHYDNSDRESRISQIKYTGNDNTGLAPYMEINFEYKIRKDKNKVYDGGYSIASEHLLTKIMIKDAVDIFKSYQFNYALQGWAEKSFLQSVEELAGDGSKLNDTRFKLNVGTDGGLSYYTPEVSELNIEMPARSAYPFYGYYYSYNEVLNVADFNGDGINEIYVTQRRTKNPYASTIDNAWSDISIKAYRSGGFGSVVYSGTDVAAYSEQHKLRSLPSAGYNKILLPYDYNGDGKADIFSYKLDVNRIDKRTIHYSASSSTALSFSANDMPALSAPDDLKAAHFNLHGDFDGDKNMDFITIVKNSDDFYKLYISFPKLDQWDRDIIGPSGTANDRLLAKEISGADIALIVDYNGDGKSEVLTYRKSTFRLEVLDLRKSASGAYVLNNVIYSEYLVAENIYPADFNGDGKTDLLLLSRNSYGYRNLELAYSKGYNGFEKKAIPYGQKIHCEGAGFNVLIGDLDGSGTADFIAMNEFCTEDYPGTPTRRSDYLTFLNDGFGKFHTSAISPASPSDDVIDEEVTPILADIDGDGVDDFVYKAVENNKLKVTRYKSRANLRLLKEVTDGFNRTTEFIYDPLTKGGDIYTKGSGETYPVNNAQYPVYVVTSLKTPDGIGGISTTAYRYENLRLHRAGRGLLGFEKIRAINFSTGFETQTQYALNTEFYVPYLKSNKTFLSRDPSVYSLSTNNYSFTRIGSGYCFTQTNPSGSTEDLLSGTSSSYSNTYDADGNITNSISRLNGDVTITTTAETNYIKVAGSPFFNAPSETTVTTTRSGNPSVMDKTILEYDAKGRLIHSYTNPNGVLSAETVHNYRDYDTYGNKTMEKKFCVGSPYTPITWYEYDGTGRFVNKQRNALGDYTSANTHKFWGKPTKLTSLNGLTATYTYDAWGNLTAETVPVSASFSYTRSYSTGWDVGTNQLYYTLVQDPSTPDVKTWYDQLGRAVRTQQEHFSGAWTTTMSSYDARGNAYRQTNEYLSTETPLQTDYTYDERNRISTETSVAGTTRYEYVISGGSTFTTVKLPDGKIKKTKTDASGKLIESGNGMAGTVVFAYDSRGNELQASMKVFSGTAFPFVRKEYDSRGRLVKLDDADAGATTYKYNPFGKLKEQKDPKGKITTFTYGSGLGLLQQKVLDGVTTIYTYYDKLKGYQLQQESVNSTAYGAVTDEYDYNVSGAPVRHSRNTNGVMMEKTFGYDSYGRALTTAYSSGLRTRQHYKGNGALEKITTDFTGGGPGEQLLYRADEMRGDGQVKKFTRSNGLQTELSYDNAYLSRIHDLSGVLDIAMDYDFTNGNLRARGDLRAKTQEFFSYDAADRLSSSLAEQEDASGSVWTWPAIDIEYDVPSPHWTGSYGRIVSKSDAGQYRYRSFPRNGVASITDPDHLVPHPTQQISYTPFHKTDKITETIGATPYEESFVYDVAENRAYSEQLQGGSLTHRRWYMGDYERDEHTGSAPQQIHYISGDAGLSAIVVEEGGSFTYYAAYSDHLGSIVLLTDDAGTPVYRQAYDPWGRERDPETWNDGTTGLGTKPRWLTRGYTGHEMLPEYGLVNMNGRMYDPLNGRMLRPDNYVAYPDNTQSYNRYSYALNNPMRYVDPDGNNPILIGLAMGVLYGALNGGSQSMNSGGRFLDGAVGGAAYGALYSMAGSALSFGVGEIFGATMGMGTVNGFANEVGRAAAHGTTGYFLGGRNPAAFLGGAFGSLAGSVGANIGGFLNTFEGSLLFASGVGGAASAIGGGSFSDGAMFAAISHLANQKMHEPKQRPKDGLPGFPGSDNGKHDPQSGRWRWRLPNGDIGEWDSRHGEVEVYDKSGKNHKGGFDPQTGKQRSPAKPGRTTPKMEGVQEAINTINRFRQVISRPASAPSAVPLPVPSIIPWIDFLEMPLLNQQPNNQY